MLLKTQGKATGRKCLQQQKQLLKLNLTWMDSFWLVGQQPTYILNNLSGKIV
jgi:hypothetical protein